MMFNERNDMHTIRRRTWAIILCTVTVCITCGLSLTACSSIKDRLMTPDPPVHEQQRLSALYFRDVFQPNVEKIRFTRDGDRPGLGASWCVNAIATIENHDYYIIIGPSLGPSFVGGTGEPPDAPTPAPHQPLTLTYSDGTTETIP